MGTVIKYRGDPRFGQQGDPCTREILPNGPNGRRRKHGISHPIRGAYHDSPDTFKTPLVRFLSLIDFFHEQRVQARRTCSSPVVFGHSSLVIQCVNATPLFPRALHPTTQRLDNYPAFASARLDEPSCPPSPKTGQYTAFRIETTSICFVSLPARTKTPTF